MKKILLIMLILPICYLVVGCLENSTNQEKIGTDMCNEIMRCIHEEDIESFKSMFCDQISDAHDLDSEIKLAFDFFDGKILSHDKFLIGGGDSMRDGELTDSHIVPIIDNIKTDTGKTYKITYLSYIVLNQNERLIGMQYMIIRDENDETIMIGEYIY